MSSAIANRYSAPTLGPSPPHTPTPLENELVRLSRRIIELLNARDYTNPFFSTHVSPSVHIDFNGARRGEGLKDFIGFYRLDADVSSNFYGDVDITTAMVSEEMGTATVILSQVLQGFEDELMRGKKRATTILWSWRRVGGKEGRGGWMCMNCSLMFGTCEFLV